MVQFCKLFVFNYEYIHIYIGEATDICLLLCNSLVVEFKENKKYTEYIKDNKQWLIKFLT